MPTADAIVVLSEGREVAPGVAAMSECTCEPDSEGRVPREGKTEEAVPALPQAGLKPTGQVTEIHRSRVDMRS